MNIMKIYTPFLQNKQGYYTGFNNNPNDKKRGDYVWPVSYELEITGTNLSGSIRRGSNLDEPKATILLKIGDLDIGYIWFQTKS